MLALVSVISSVFVAVSVLVRHSVIRPICLRFVGCVHDVDHRRRALTGICAQIQIDTWQIQTMEIPRYCDSDQIMVASSPRIVIGAHLQVLVTPPNLVASFFGKRVAILAHGVRNGDCHQVRNQGILPLALTGNYSKLLVDLNKEEDICSTNIFNLVFCM